MTARRPAGGHQTSAGQDATLGGGGPPPSGPSTGSAGGSASGGRDATTGAGATASTGAATAGLPARCLRLLEQLRRQCPTMIPQLPLEPGEVFDLIERDEAGLKTLVELALGGGSPTSGLVWRDVDSEVVLRPAQTRVAMRPGLVLIGVALETAEYGARMVTVPLVVGSKQHPSGMLVATERRPRGLPALVDRWGGSALAAAYRALLDSATAIAASAGVDRQREPLVPAGLLAESNRLNVVAQARHPFDVPTT